MPSSCTSCTVRESWAGQSKHSRRFKVVVYLLLFACYDAKYETLLSQAVFACWQSTILFWPHIKEQSTQAASLPDMLWKCGPKVYLTTLSIKIAWPPWNQVSSAKPLLLHPAIFDRTAEAIFACWFQLLEASWVLVDFHVVLNLSKLLSAEQSLQVSWSLPIPFVTMQFLHTWYLMKYIYKYIYYIIYYYIIS